MDSPVCLELGLKPIAKAEAGGDDGDIEGLLERFPGLMALRTAEKLNGILINQLIAYTGNSDCEKIERSIMIIMILSKNVFDYVE